MYPKIVSRDCTMIFDICCFQWEIGNISLTNATCWVSSVINFRSFTFFLPCSFPLLVWTCNVSLHCCPYDNLINLSASQLIFIHPVSKITVFASSGVKTRLSNLVICLLMQRLQLGENNFDYSLLLIINFIATHLTYNKSLCFDWIVSHTPAHSQRALSDS